MTDDVSCHPNALQQLSQTIQQIDSRQLNEYRQTFPYQQPPAISDYARFEDILSTNSAPLLDNSVFPKSECIGNKNNIVLKQSWTSEASIVKTLQDAFDRIEIQYSQADTIKSCHSQQLPPQLVQRLPLSMRYPMPRVAVQTNSNIIDWKSAFENAESVNAKDSFWENEFQKYSAWEDLEGSFEENLFEEIWDRANAAQPMPADWLAEYNNYHTENNYVFEKENKYLNNLGYTNMEDLFEAGLRLRHEHYGGRNLTEAALAFEAAIQSASGNSASSPPQLVDNTKSKVTEAWLNLAECHAENEKEMAAISAYRQCLKEHPTHLKALLGLAVSYTNEGNGQQVLDLLTTWIQTQYPGFEYQPDLSSAENNRLNLIHHFLTVIRGTAIKNTSENSPSEEIQVGDPDLQIGLGILYYQAGAGDLDRAVDCFRTALVHRPEDYRLWNRLGATLANAHRAQEAIEHYERALAIKPNFIRALHNLGVSSLNVGKHELAMHYFLQALSQHSSTQYHTSKNLWDTLRRTFIFMDRDDLALLCDQKNLEAILLLLQKSHISY